MTVLDHRNQPAEADTVPGWRPGATAPRTDPAPLLPDAAPHRVLGTPAAADADPELLRELYRRLVAGRRYNQQATTLTKQGRLAVYPASTGQEACQVAAALCTPLATQVPHAVGLAHAARLAGDDTVALALLGDGGTSEGDFHEGLNFAAVLHAPVVFLVQNNGYAISVPLTRQSAAPTLAHKAVGYGMPGRLVDGNDARAVHAARTEAVERARTGGGPTLV